MKGKDLSKLSVIRHFCRVFNTALIALVLCFTFQTGAFAATCSSVSEGYYCKTRSTTMGNIGESTECPAGCYCPGGTNVSSVNSIDCSSHTGYAQAIGGGAFICPNGMPNSAAQSKSLTNCYTSVSLLRGKQLSVVSHSSGFTVALETCSAGYYCSAQSAGSARVYVPSMFVGSNNESIAGSTVLYSYPCSENATSSSGAEYCTCKSGYSGGGGRSDRSGANCAAVTTYTIIFDANGGSGGTTQIYTRENTGVYTDSACTTQMTTSGNAITVPTKSGWIFQGYYSDDSSSATQYINAAGFITDAGITAATTGNGSLTWVAIWRKYCSAGTYWNATDRACATCVSGNYCSSVTVFSYNSGSNLGLTQCPSGYTSSQGRGSVYSCYKTNGSLRCNAWDDRTISPLATLTYANNSSSCFYYYGSSSICVPAPGACDVTGASCDSGYYSTATASTLRTAYSNEAYSDYTEFELNGNEECDSNCGRNGKNDGEWETMFSYGTVRGRSRCYTSSTSAPTDDSVISDGQYCWCRLEKFKPSGGSSWLQAKTSYMYAQNMGTASYCADECSYVCAVSLMGEGAADELSRSDLVNASTQYVCDLGKYTITLNNNGATTAGTTEIYTTYNTGVYLDSARTKQMTAVSSVNYIDKPQRSGWTFMGYYNSSYNAMYIDAYGGITTMGQNAKRYTSDATWYAKWQIDRCSSGMYWNGSSCVTCTSGYYCEGGYVYNNSTSGMGRTQCPSGYTSDTGMSTIYGCYQTGTTTCTAYTYGVNSITYLSNPTVSCRKYYGATDVCIPTPNGVCDPNTNNRQCNADDNNHHFEYTSSSLQNVSVSTTSTSSNYITNSASHGQARSATYPSDNGEFDLVFSYGTVHGRTKCSTSSGTDNSTQSSINSTEGQYCWCKTVTFTPSDSSTVQMAESNWGYRQDLNTTESCRNTCAEACSVIGGSGYQTLRTNLYNSSKGGVCALNIYEITLNPNGATNSPRPNIYYIPAEHACLDEDCENVMTSNTNPIGSGNSLPQRVEAMYPTTFNGNGGTISGNTTVTVDSKYVFNGYWSASTGGIQYIGSTGYITSNGLSYLQTASGPLEWYVRWGQSLVSVPTSIRTGYRFTGWYSAPTGGSIIIPAGTSTFYPRSTPRVLYAHWEPNTSNISYVMNGGINYNGAPTTHTYGTATVINGTPTHQYGTFAGWCTDSGLTSCAMTQTVADNTLIDVTFYAKWDCMPGYSGTTCSVQPVSITYITDRGTAPTQPDMCEYGDTLTLPPAPTGVVGYKFTGWTLVTCGLNNIDVDIDTPLDATHTRWKPASYPAGHTMQVVLGTENSSDLGNGEWAMVFSYGTVKGNAKCSSTSGVYPQPGNPSNTSGQNCWCQANRYIPSGANMCPVASPTWIYHHEFVQDACDEYCAYSCVRDIQNEANYREAIYGTD